ncbi:hypothetical protein TNCV_178591 [Trichonephila clavipes]|nr:hypothetical protein TNCV_178591 [Trichonephila clavipes]
MFRLSDFDETWNIYANGSHLLAALGEYRRCLKDLQKGPISRIDLRKMIMKFKDSGDSGLLPGRGRKPVATETVQEVTTVLIERDSSFIYSSESGRSV